MDFWRSARKSRKENVRNFTIRKVMGGAEEDFRSK
jgi:hypothetical protein